MLHEIIGLRCSAYGETKDPSDFYDQRNGRCGKMHTCKACHKRRMFANRRDNPKVQEYERLRAKEPHRVAGTD